MNENLAIFQVWEVFVKIQVGVKNDTTVNEYANKYITAVYHIGFVLVGIVSAN